MRWNATTSVVLIVLCLVSSARPVAAAATALGTSAWSLEIGTNVGAGNQDGSFAIRKHTSASSAFRLGIEGDLDASDGNGTRTNTGSPDADAEISFEFNSTYLSIQWMHFAPIRDNVTATFAVGPVVGLARDFQRIKQLTQEVEFVSRSTRFGLDLGFGVEWFFNRRFSLGGRTGLRAVTGSGSQVAIYRSPGSKTETNLDLDQTELSVGTARIQLMGYF
jgi:hypothetical protein